MVLETFILGTSGSLPLPKRGLTSVLLHREGEEFLFDCGEGVQINLKSMHLRWKNLQAICVSHSHADHVTGLLGMLMLSSQVDRTTPLTVICPSQVCNFIQAARKHLGIHINYEIEYILLDDIEKKEVIYQNKEKGYKLSVFPGKHTRAVWGFAFEEDMRFGKFHSDLAEKHNVPMGPLWSQLQKGKTVVLEDGKKVFPSDVLGESRKGRKVCYVTDTRPTDDIAEAIADSDLVFCEGMFKDEHRDLAKEKMHMTGREAAELISRAGGIDKAGLLHFSPRYLFKDILEIERDAQQVFSNIFCCKDKMHIPIAYKNE